MSQTMTYTGRLVITSCWCGVHLAIPSDLHAEANREGTTVWCPLGHKFVYENTTADQLAATKARLAEERRRVRATRDLLAHEERSHASTKGHLTRQKRRAAAGVCACCGRTFQDVARHMESQHPDFVKDAKR